VYGRFFKSSEWKAHLISVAPESEFRADRCTGIFEYALYQIDGFIEVGKIEVYFNGLDLEFHIHLGTAADYLSQAACSQRSLKRNLVSIGLLRCLDWFPYSYTDEMTHFHVPPIPDGQFLNLPKKW